MVKLITYAAALTAICGAAFLVTSKDEGAKKNLRSRNLYYKYTVGAKNDDDYFTPQEVKDMAQKLQSNMYATAQQQKNNMYGQEDEEEEDDSGEEAAEGKSKMVSLPIKQYR